MIKHIVLFQLKDELTQEQRAEVMNTFKAGIEQLPAVIIEIVDISVNFNCNEAEAWDICLESTFASMADLETYAQHPDHKAVGAALRPHMAARSCVDYEC
ncbi:MAG: Dabb family protein [Bacteroidaceae bacterium]|nr:Dabb family protein [Bacteroidaceae bacterium]